ncbi:PKD domain-containing protein [Zunongwangia sp. H14]|uniref:PKD domain-containing protein n=1 Tax=Zunongwangia sp. H14 TaxID=3240792 RepID=UPI0035663B7F
MKNHKILLLTVMAIASLVSCQPEDPPLNEFSDVFIDWSPRTINVNDSVSILDGSRGVKERLWTLPGGGVVDVIGSDNDATSTERILHTKFLAPGVFDIRLQDQFNDPSVTLDSLITITVLEHVIARFTSDVEGENGEITIEAGDTVNFNSNSSTGSPEFFEWTFEGGEPATSTGSNPSVQYNLPGSWDVTLIAYRNFPRGADTIVVRDYLTVLE